VICYRQKKLEDGTFGPEEAIELVGSFIWGFDLDGRRCPVSQPGVAEDRIPEHWAIITGGYRYSRYSKSQ
jgi:hypothetical protein